MQKQTKQFHHRHHVRASTVAIALATGFHIGGLGHLRGGAHETALSFSQALTSHMERENETSRHIVRFDEGMRLPSISGGEV